MEAPNAEAIISKTINFPDSNIEISCYKSSILISYIDLNNNKETQKKFSYLFPFTVLLENNHFFHVYRSIEDIYNFLLDKINKNLFSISKTGNHLDFEVKIDAYGVPNPKFILVENEQEKNEKIEKLVNSLTKIENENSELKKEIITLETDNSQIKKKIINLENNYQNLNSQLELIKIKLKENNDSNSNKTLKEDIFTDSTILSIEEKKIISNWFDNNCNFKMIYKAKRDGDTAEKFHNKCDGKKNNIIIIQTINGIKFGGYTSKSWEGEGYKEDTEAFVFSINKAKKYPIKNNINFYKNAIYCNPNHGPRFGGGREIFILDNCCNTNQNECNSPDSYDTLYQSELTLGSGRFRVFDYEVYQIEL